MTDPIPVSRGRQGWVVFVLCLVVVAVAVVTVVAVTWPTAPAEEPAVQPTASGTVRPTSEPSVEPTTIAGAVEVEWPRTGPLRVLVAGDSIARGGFASNQALAFPQLVVAELEDDGEVLKEGSGLSGQGSYAIAAELLSSTWDHDLVIVEAGTNDVPGGAVESFRAGYEVLLDRVRERNEGASLLCLGPWADAASAAAFNVVAQEICEDHDGVFAPLDHLYARTENRSPSDNFHPSDDGHAAIARVVMQHLAVVD